MLTGAMGRKAEAYPRVFTIRVFIVMATAVSNSQVWRWLKTGAAGQSAAHYAAAHMATRACTPLAPALQVNMFGYCRLIILTKAVTIG